MNEEISREALLIYLNDLRIMETIIHESDCKIKSINELQNNAKADCSRFEKAEPVKPLKPLMRTKENASASDIIYVIFACGLIVFLLIFGFVNDFFPAILIGGALLIYSIYSLINKKAEKDSALGEYNYLLTKYKKECDEYQKNMQEYERMRREKIDFREEVREKSDKSIDEINAEKNDISEKLQEAYNANIIPLAFRNIHGIYYLYDYLSTSNQSLSEALMQCNLEAIKEKLDNVIELQKKSIVQQAQANAAIYEQNQRILETAQATMNNTAVAAKYAQISAVNSALSLKLQQKDLAYQRADFWLK